MKCAKKSHERGCQIIRKLFDEGYVAYFAGGWVRDFLLGHASDEIDIATNASPEKICALFAKTIPVGIAFGVVIVIVDDIQFEITTFRKDHPYLDGRHPDGVDYSTPEKDAQRRDFTINGMFYDPLTNTLHDYVGGQHDLKKGIIRAIGDARHRFQEDRLRMIRAVRFAIRFKFAIERQTKNAIVEHAATLLPAVSMERVMAEFHKMRPLVDGLLYMHELHLLEQIFPSLKNTSQTLLTMRLTPLQHLPKSTPTIVYLMELFPTSSLEEQIEICRYLKISNHEVKIVEFLHNSTPIFKEQAPTLYDWAHFYAHEHADLTLTLTCAKLALEKRASFLKEHELRKAELAVDIVRIQSKHPFIRAEDLMREGIAPGQKMGLLLKEGEKIVINGRLSDKKEALAQLKNSKYWNL